LSRHIVFDIRVFFQIINLAIWNAFFYLLIIDYICDSYTLKLKFAKKIKKTRNVKIDCIKHIKKSESLKDSKKERIKIIIAQNLKLFLTNRKLAKTSRHVLKRECCNKNIQICKIDQIARLDYAINTVRQIIFKQITR